MLVEVIGGALLGKALSGGSVKPIKNATKKYVVVCNNKIDGNEILNIPFISSDAKEACIWAQTAAQALASLVGAKVGTRTDNDNSLCEYNIEFKTLNIKYAVFEA